MRPHISSAKASRPRAAPRWTSFAPSKQSDRAEGLHPPALIPDYIVWLMDRDRKSPGLKTLQGLIWQDGYRSGELRGEVYPDVPPALERWRARGIDIYIYSSGSVLAQQLLFESTDAGDLTRFLTGYFDTAVGPKHAPDSYRAIAARIHVAPPQMLFVSDIAAELDAAAAAGWHTALCVRGAWGCPIALRTRTPAFAASTKSPEIGLSADISTVPSWFRRSDVELPEIRL